MEGLEVDSEDLSLSSRVQSPPQVPRFLLYRRIGALNCFCVLSSGKPLFCLGPDWGYFLCMVSTILFLDNVFFFLMYPSSPTVFQFCGIFVFSFLTLTYVLCALLDPGLALGGLSLNKSIPDLEERMKDLRYCGNCGVLRSTETFHCDDCNVCISGYDHHCPFTGKCIGQGNLLFFQGFLLSILLVIIYSFIWIVLQARFDEKH